MTLLIGRLYPSMAVFASVCDTKGRDELAIDRLASFIKESGVARLVYKTDQEPAINVVADEAVEQRLLLDMTEEALKRAGRSGTIFDPKIEQAVAENSAVGESASNGKAERTVQIVEDLLRTLKSALESRINSKIPVSHPIIRWLVEHCATILNRYSVNKEGQTPYFCFHGKRATDRVVEFGEKNILLCATQITRKT